MLTPSLICLPLVAPVASPNGTELTAPLAVTASSVTTATPQDDGLYGDAPWHTLRWKYLQFDRQLGDPDGWKLSGSYPINENVYLAASNLFFQEGGVNGDLFQFGGGYHEPLDVGADEGEAFHETEWYGQAFFQGIDAAGFQETGYELSVGLRSILAERIEGQIEVGYTNIDRALSNTYFQIRGEYEFTRNLAATLAFQVDDEEFLNIGVRYYPDLN